MLMADNSSENFTLDEGISPDDDDSERLCVDLDVLWGLIEETPESDQKKPEDSPVKILPQGFPKLEEGTFLGINGPGSDACSYSFNSEVSDSRAGSSEGSSNSAGKSVIFDTVKQEYSAQNGTPACSLTGSLSDWNSQKPSCSSQDISFEAKGLTCNCSTEKSDIAYGSYGDLVESSSQSLGAPYVEDSTIVDTSLSNYEFVDFDIPLIESPGAFYDQDSIGSDSTSYFDPTGQYSAEDIRYQYFESNCHGVANVKDEYGLGGGPFSAALETANSYTSRTNENVEGVDYILPKCGFSYDNSDFGQTFGKMSSAENLPQVMSNTYSKEPAVCVKDEKSKVRSYMTTVGVGGRKFHGVADQLSSKKQAFHIKDEQNDERCATQETAYRSFINVDNMADWKSCDVADGLYVDKGPRQSVTGSLTSTVGKRQVIANDEIKDAFSAPSGDHYSFGNSETCTILNPVADSRSLDIQELDQPCFMQSQHIKEERESKLTQSYRGSHFSNRSHQAVHNSALVRRSHVDDDSDICILENLSKPARLNHSPMSVNMNISSRSSSYVESPNHFDVGGMRVKTKDERNIFRAALQDISQPKSESTPPDGLLAVPLLKHQRIALSWMVQKETNSLQCSGGILADDQGLGKTISTIALILKERSPSSKVCTINNKNLETLNLDDDDSVAEFSDTNLGTGSSHNSVGGSSTRVRNLSMQLKVKPAAGTLIVCPTSVLRQWSEELHSKVTKAADLSVLTYHGGNRTKDPSELAKYDIVLTTYAIVSMEVPKQPLVDKDDEETGRHSHLQPMEHPSTKKRKYPPSSGERSLKCKKDNNGLIEAAARPLAQVRWFRVVLDEAQSIKNYKTQVARACWGLRAKRRWCLSGTPIQNSIDDLYSYFRFLKYDPYAAYKSFCSTIKVPIQKNPANGYRKLQAVLKTIMLRRTKGTFLDGEPIINLPPKTIELKKVEFTMEERDFYCTLEAESRAQFAKYAEAGTVKQNYVNILLMLLRLRQACDHPLLVRGCGSDSVWSSSVEMAKKLPSEKQASLLNCLEASLAICGMCNDPPEDAVVASCGHVFCNQCICEHLTSDDNQCPTSNCKVRLSVSSVYSKATLKTSLSEGLGSVADCSGSVLAKTLQPCSSGRPFDSSKIKAAIEVLQSLSKPGSLVQKTSSSVSIDGGSRCMEDLSNTFLGGSHSNIHDKQSVDLDNGSNNLVPAVGEKAIVFSQWTRMLDLLEAGLKGSSINYRRLDGTMSVIARDKAVKDFNTQPEVSVIIMSLKAASLGLNMVAACHVLLLDLWWNPTTEDQAIDRAHRIGQTRPVSVLRLTVKDTVEDRILALQQKKREMVASAFGEDETGSRQTRLTVQDLQYLFMYN